MGLRWLSWEKCTFCFGAEFQHFDESDRTIRDLTAAIFRNSEATGRCALERRRTCRDLLGASSCCTASSAGEAMEIRRARLPTRAIRHETVLANLAAFTLVLLIEDCRILSKVPSGLEGPPHSNVTHPPTNHSARQKRFYSR